MLAMEITFWNMFLIIYIFGALIALGIGMMRFYDADRTWENRGFTLILCLLSWITIIITVLVENDYD